MLIPASYGSIIGDGIAERVDRLYSEKRFPSDYGKVSLPTPEGLQ